MRLAASLAVLAVIATSGAAYAQTSTGVGVGTADSESTSEATSVSSSEAVNAGNAQAQQITFEGSHIPRERLQAPSTVPPTVVVGHNCGGGISGGVSFPGGSVAVGRTTEDTDCETMRTFGALVGIGETGVALQFLCNRNEDVAEAFAQEGRADCAPIGAHRIAEASTGVDFGKSNSDIAVAPAVTAPAVPAASPPIEEAALRGTQEEDEGPEGPQL